MTFRVTTSGSAVSFVAQSITTTTNGVHVSKIKESEIPEGMKLSSQSIGYGKFNGRCKINTHFKNCTKVCLRDIYIDGTLVQEWVYLPLSDASDSTILHRTSAGLSFGDQIVVSASHDEDIVVGNLLIDLNGVLVSTMTM